MQISLIIIPSEINYYFFFTDVATEAKFAGMIAGGFKPALSKVSSPRTKSYLLRLGFSIAAPSHQRGTFPEEEHRRFEIGHTDN